MHTLAVQGALSDPERARLERCRWPRAHLSLANPEYNYYYYYYYYCCYCCCDFDCDYCYYHYYYYYYYFY